MKNLLLLQAMLLFSILSYGQAGMNIYGGISTMRSQDENFTAKDLLHSGYVLGLHGRLNSDDLYFLFTGEYGNFDLIAKEAINFDINDNLKYFKFKVGLGLDFLHFKNKIGLRTKIQGSLLAVSNYNEAEIQNSNLRPEYKKINDGSAGVTTSLGMFIGPFTADVGYEIGILNFVNQIKTSKLNYLDFTVGLRF